MSLSIRGTPTRHACIFESISPASPAGASLAAGQELRAFASAIRPLIPICASGARTANKPLSDRAELRPSPGMTVGGSAAYLVSSRSRGRCRGSEASLRRGSERSAVVTGAASGGESCPARAPSKAAQGCQRQLRRRPQAPRARSSVGQGRSSSTEGRRRTLARTALHSSRRRHSCRRRPCGQPCRPCRRATLARAHSQAPRRQSCRVSAAYRHQCSGREPARSCRAPRRARWRASLYATLVTAGCQDSSS
mmetsp:Transcript_31443/g.66218  ORF Transcript_31443/g.66218 Transcript_31443/m.66218 type:complete len:251 (-) Transcript_31443:376-1128(-)